MELISVLKCPRSLTLGHPQRLAQLPCCWQVEIPLPHTPNYDLYIGHVDAEECTLRGGKTSQHAREHVQNPFLASHNTELLILRAFSPVVSFKVYVPM